MEPTYRFDEAEGMLTSLEAVLFQFKLSNTLK